MAAIWFYADPQNQQQGPVEAAWLAEAYRSGAVTAQTLVWREGLAGWVPLAQVAAQFGLIVIGAAPPLPAAAPAAGTRIAKPSGSSSAAVVVVVVIVGFIAVSGILAAIALPAYQDYTVRARVAEGAMLAGAVKTEVVEYSEAHQRCPHNGDEGFSAASDYKSNYVSEIKIGANGSTGECAVEVTYANVTAINGKKLRYTLAHDGSWHTSTDIPSRYLTTSMRNAMQ